MTKMNPEAKAKIVAALRSGKYKQARGWLHPSAACFCVWGIICDVSKVAEWVLDTDGYRMFDNTAIPPMKVQEWAGIRWCYEDKVTIDGKLLGLSDHNDHGVPFDVLAQAIEEQL